MTALAGDVRAPATPYKGLRPYTTADEAFFFGRDDETHRICKHLLAYRLTLLYGPSGVGKSSLLAAGVKSRLDEEARQGAGGSAQPEQITVVFPSPVIDVGRRRESWRDDPLVAIPAAIREAAREAGLDVELPDHPDLARMLADWSLRLDAEIFVILDQFEEYILYHGDEDGPGTLTAELPRVVTTPGLGANVLIAIREDAFTQLDRFKGRIPLLYEHQIRLEHLSRASARQAIHGPIGRYNEQHPAEPPMGADEDLVEKVLSELERGDVGLGQSGSGSIEQEERDGGIQAPFLQLVMERLWLEEREKGSNRLRLSTFEEHGEAEEIVRTHFETAMGALTEDSRDVAARMFRQLVTPSGTKIAYVPSDLANYVELDVEPVRTVLERLTDERLLSQIAPPPGASEPRYEIFHDVLAPAVLDWSARWLASSRYKEKERRLHAERAAAEAAAKRDRAAARRQRRWTGVAVLLALLAIGAAVWAYMQTQQAERNERSAVDARKSADDNIKLRKASAQLQRNPAGALLGLRDVLRGSRSAPSDETVEALRTALQTSTLIAVLRPGTDAVRVAAFSRDGDRAVTAAGARLNVWTAATGMELAEVDLGAPVRAVAFNRAGTSLVAGLRNGQTVIWHWRTDRVEPLGGGDSPASTVGFTRDDSRVLAVNQSELRMWKPGTSRPVFRYRLPDVPNVTTLAPDGSHVLLGFPGSPVLLDTKTGDDRTLRWPQGKTQIPTAAAFSSNGRYVVVGGDAPTPETEYGFESVDAVGDSGSSKASMSLWSTSSSRPISRTVSSTQITSVAVDRNGKRAAFGSADGVVRTWSTRRGEKGKVLRIMRDHTDRVTRVGFSRNGSWLLTSSADGTARLWSVANGREAIAFRGHGDAVGLATLSDDGKTVLTGSHDRTARLWRLGMAPPRARLRYPNTPLITPAVSPDGLYVLLANSDRAARALDISTGTTHERYGKSEPFATFAADGRRVVTAGPKHYAIRSFDGTLIEQRRLRVQTYPIVAQGGGAIAIPTSAGSRILDPETGRLSKPLGHVGDEDHFLFAGAVTPDGRWFAAETSSALSVWDVRGEKRVRLLHPEFATKFALSPDGRWLVVGSDSFLASGIDEQNSTTTLYDIKKGTRRLLRTPDAAELIVFTRDDGRFAVTGGDNTTRIIDPAEPDRAVVLSGHRGGVTDMAFSKDSRLLVTGSVDGSARVWDAATGQLVQPLRLDSTVAVTNVAFTPDAKRVVVGTQNAVSVYECELCGDSRSLVSLMSRRLPVHP